MRGLLVVLLLEACSKADVASAPPAPDEAPKGKSSREGFSSDLAKDLDEPNGPRTNSNGTAGAKEQGSGSAAPPPSAPATPPSVAAATPPATPPSAAAVTPPSPAVPVAATPPAPATPPATPPAPATPPPTPGSQPTAAGPSAVTDAPVAATPVKISAELEAIELDLLPNWVRDVGTAGTISLSVTQQSTGISATFIWSYGYEAAGAPAEREAYKKWLAEQKILSVAQDRQASAAWYLQGTDGTGAAAFRVLVNFGGKKLICGGSLYKGGDNDKLGDIRDEVVIQAKKICESIALK